MKLSWLKKAGLAIAQGALKDIPFGGLISSVIDQVKDHGGTLGRLVTDAPQAFRQIAESIVRIEAIRSNGQPLSGPDKLKNVLNEAVPLIRASELVAGKEIADEALFVSGCSSIVDGVVDVLNSLKADSIKAQVEAA